MSLPRFGDIRRVVVKVGSSSLRATDGGLDRAFAATLVDQLAAVCAGGVEVVLVSSGAVAGGLEQLGYTTRPTDLPSLQAAASVGQGILVHTYQAAFSAHGIPCGQVLLTPEDVVNRTRYLNARNTFDTLLSRGAVPVVNENDAVATDELRFGDNDRLAALVASMLGARLLVLLSDVEGLHDGAPQSAPVLDRVDDIGLLEAHHYGSVGSLIGSGGMATKLEAARIATFSAAHAVIANARSADIVLRVIAGETVGTWFPPAAQRPESRKLWIAFAPQPRGSVHVDAGAVNALTQRGSSLLAVGVLNAEGDFAAGDPVDVVGPGHRVVARGLVTFPRDEILKLRGRSTEELGRSLGAAYQRAVIHRDSLVVV